jgi:putative transposase
MKTLALLVIHVLTKLAQRVGPGGVKAIIAESVLVKHQQLIVCRSGRKTPKLTTLDRFLCGFLVLFMHPGRIRKVAVVLKPATFTKFRRTLLTRNYHRLFSSRTNAKPGPKGPSDDLVRVIVELKRRNARFGCPRIAQQINRAFGLNIDKDVVRRVLAKHYRPENYDDGPSWLTFFRYMADSLWSTALFQRRSILPKILSSLIAIGQCARRIIGCGIAGCHFDQMVFWSLFTAGIPVVEASRLLSPANDPPFSHHRRRRKCLGAGRTQTLAISPRAPPFTERRIRTRRRYHLDYRLNCGAIVLETEHEALNNNYNPFPMTGLLGESRSSKINSETLPGHVESHNSDRKRYIREELRNLFAA